MVKTEELDGRRLGIFKPFCQFSTFAHLSLRLHIFNKVNQKMIFSMVEKLGFASLLLTLCIQCKTHKSEMNINWPTIAAPVAEKKEHFRDIHGDKVNDPYYWMYDFFGKGPDSQQVISYLEAENTYLKAMMADTDELQKSLFDEMKGRIKEKDESVPYFNNGYFYYSRTEEGQQYYKFCRKKGSLDAPEEILLDVDALAEGKAYYALSGFSVSENNKLLAVGIDEVSRRQYTIKIKNLETGEWLPDEIKNTEGDPVWANDNKTIFFTVKNPHTLLSEKIMRHTIGQLQDTLVYFEKDPSNYIGVHKSKNNKWIMITSSATMSSEVHLLNAATPNQEFKVFQPRMKDVIYQVTALEDKFLVLTNKDAINFKIMETPLEATGVEQWKEVQAHDSKVLIEGLVEFKDFIVIQQRENGLTQLIVKNLTDNTLSKVSFEEATYTVNISTNEDINSHVLRLNYTSLTTPRGTYDYDMITGEKTLLKQQEVLGGYNSTNYQAERLYATATDGTQIPISIVYKKGFEKNGKSPVLLYAYGSYGYSMDPTFSSARLSLLDRGFAFAIAHIRGGQEMGRQWYLDGKLMKKKNTFTDFVDCGKYLIAEKFTSSEHLYANGGSAGGLLMGAVANLAPDLFHGIIADVPFVDVVNTMLDEDIPLTTNEYDEWGNPNQKEAYEYMKSYSPYENIEKKAYPHMLVTTGLHDSQVQYFEPAKWVAKLRDLKTDDHVLLLHTNMDYGHGGASGRFDYLKDVALDYAFLLKLEGKVK